MHIGRVIPILSRATFFCLLLAGLIAGDGCTWRAKSSPARGPEEYIHGVTADTVRDDYGGWIGMKITVAALPLRVTALGCFVLPGNSQAHTVKIVQADTGEDLASVSVALAGIPAGRFQYAELPGPVTLQPQASYYVVTSEAIDGDQWYHSNTVVNTADAAACDSAVYWSNVNRAWTTEASKNNTFGPVSFRYQ